MTLPDGTLINLSLRYVELQNGWFADIAYTGTPFTLNGLRITQSPNMLRQWKNLIPFGLGCFTQNGQEPTLLQDFASGYAKLYVLSADDVALFERFLAS